MKWNNVGALKELGDTLHHIADIVSKYDGSGPPMTAERAISPGTLAQIKRFQ
jgi:hypothetical protein